MKFIGCWLILMVIAAATIANRTDIDNKKAISELRGFAILSAFLLGGLWCFLK